MTTESNFTSDLSIPGQATRIITEAEAWISGHSLQILLGVAAGTVIALLLIFIRSLICKWIERGPGELHWKTILARVAAKTKLFFILLVAAKLVVGQPASVWLEKSEAKVAAAVEIGKPGDTPQKPNEK